jgi:hypothetical protein
VAGLSLFIGLPGIGAELALLRYHTPVSPWERLAVIGALGLAASGLASLLLVATGTPITEASVGLACASIAVSGLVISVIAQGWPVIRERPFAILRIPLALALIVSGAVIGSTIGSHEGADPYTILALEDPLHARAALQASLAQRGQTTVSIIVESHEAGAGEYQLSVVGGSRSSLFSLQPAERRVMQVEVSPLAADSIEIQLWKSGRLYRSLRLTAPDASRS